MIDIRDGMKDCASLGINYVNDIIDEICLNLIECIFNFKIHILKLPFLCEIKILYDMYQIIGRSFSINKILSLSLDIFLVMP